MNSEIIDFLERKKADYWRDFKAGLIYSSTYKSRALTIDELIEAAKKDLLLLENLNSKI